MPSCFLYFLLYKRKEWLLEMSGELVTSAHTNTQSTTGTSRGGSNSTKELAGSWGIKSRRYFIWLHERKLYILVYRWAGKKKKSDSKPQGIDSAGNETRKQITPWSGGKKKHRMKSSGKGKIKTRWAHLAKAPYKIPSRDGAFSQNVKHRNVHDTLRTLRTGNRDRKSVV